MYNGDLDYLEFKSIRTTINILNEYLDFLKDKINNYVKSIKTEY